MVSCFFVPLKEDVSVTLPGRAEKRVSRRVPWEKHWILLLKVASSTGHSCDDRNKWKNSARDKGQKRQLATEQCSGKMRGY
jgi:hypothetical protein